MKFLIIIFFIIIHIFADTSVHILYSSSLNGNLDGCTCSSSPKSGLVKRAYFINEYKKKYPQQTILVDTGDMFSVYTDKFKQKYILQAFEYLKFDAIAVGDQEFICNIKFLTNDLFKKLPFISANLIFDNHKFTEYKIIKKENINIGIIGITHKDTFKYARIGNTEDYISFENEIKNINNLITQLKTKTDCIILLSHSGYDHEKEYAKQIQGIDFIIGGHSQTLLQKPEKINNTVLLHSGENGNLQGILIITFKNKQNSQYSHKFEDLNYSTTSDDKYIRTLLDNWEKDLQESYRKLK